MNTVRIHPSETTWTKDLLNILFDLGLELKHLLNDLF